MAGFVWLPCFATSNVPHRVSILSSYRVRNTQIVQIVYKYLIFLHWKDYLVERCICVQSANRWELQLSNPHFDIITGFSSYAPYKSVSQLGYIQMK